jgi:ABC-2 type transport system ATP-binding protein
MKDKVAIKISNLSKKYQNNKVLDVVSLKIPKGKIVGLVGANGSGKSTLLKIISGLIKPCSGQINVLDRMNIKKLKEDIAFLPEVNHFYRWMTIRELINFYNKQFNNFDLKKAKELVEFMKLDLDKKIKNLSRGLISRAKLVVTLAREVPIIIMDEPLAGIDPNSRDRILESLINEYQMGEQTIILATHEILEVEKYFEHVIFLKEGLVKLEGNADNLRREYKSSIRDISTKMCD